MAINVISKIRRATLAYGMGNWAGHFDETDLKLTDCVNLIDYLKHQSSIPPEQELWCSRKIAKLVTEAKWRKLGFFAAHTLIIFCAILAVAMSLLTLECSLAADMCAASTPKIQFGLVGTFVATFALWQLKKAIARDRRQTAVADHFSPTLSEEQKENLLREITYLEHKTSPIYEARNHKTLRKFPEASWLAENWFIILTPNECDRYAIWLDGFYPKGELYICLLYTSPSPRDQRGSRMPSSA